MNYYNEWDSFAAAWLKELIKDGLIPDGEVDSRSIADVEPSDLKGFTQCHFFAGIGGWSRALQLAGGVQIDLFGQEALPANLSQQPETIRQRRPQTPMACLLQSHPRVQTSNNLWRAGCVSN
jgi:hypothetical protein